MIRQLFFINEHPDVNTVLVMLLMLANVLIIVGVYFYLDLPGNKNRVPKDATRILGTLALVWLGFSIVWGLILTFDALETSGNTFMLKAFTDGFEVAMRIMMTGLLLICLPLFIYLRIGLASNKKGQY
jgi:hypothetical protein